MPTMNLLAVKKPQCGGSVCDLESEACEKLARGLACCPVFLSSGHPNSRDCSSQLKKNIWICEFTSNCCSSRDAAVKPFERIVFFSGCDR